MPSRARRAPALVAASTVLVALLGATAPAGAEPSKPSPAKADQQEEKVPGPSKDEVSAARADAQSKASNVAAIRTELVLAVQRVQSAVDAAQMAAEEYNGAVYHLSQARKATRRAELEVARAAARQRVQQRNIAGLVLQSYQDGSSLGSMGTVLNGDGPQGVMAKFGAFQSTHDSMQAQVDSYRVLGALAANARVTAAAAQKNQSGLARTARGKAAEAADYAATAQALANGIAARRASLIAALARAQDISVDLAQQRQGALEQVARRKVADQARARENAEARAAEAARARAEVAASVRATSEKARQQAEETSRKADKARTDADQAKQDAENAVRDVEEVDDLPVIVPGGPPDPIDLTPPDPSAGVERIIAFARAQVGEPYVWAAAGPSTWDCSGLTMAAWAAAGRSLPHYSVAQYDQGTPIAISAAKPGDLLFWTNNGRPSGIHHVALYAGKGEFIEAPYTGALVRTNSIYTAFPDFAVRL